MDYDIPPTTYLPIEEDSYDNWKPEEPENETIVINPFTKLKDVLFAIGLFIILPFSFITFMQWVMPHYGHEPTLKEVVISELKWIKHIPAAIANTVTELANRKSLEEIAAEKIKGKSITEYWGNNLNATHPFIETNPDSLYLQPVDLYSWYHPELNATINLEIGTITPVYSGSGTMPTSAWSYPVATLTHHKYRYNPALKIIIPSK